MGCKKDIRLKVSTDDLRIKREILLRLRSNFRLDLNKPCNRKLLQSGATGSIDVAARVVTAGILKTAHAKVSKECSLCGRSNEATYLAKTTRRSIDAGETGGL